MERRQTRQRQLILNAVHTLKHPTADEVYAAVADAQPPVGRATVYRNLNLLAEQGTAMTDARSRTITYTAAAAGASSTHICPLSRGWSAH